VRFLLNVPSEVVAGVPFDITVTAFDAYGQVSSGYTGTVTFASSDTDPGVILRLIIRSSPATTGRILSPAQPR